eukprot:9686489-Karenia_brevis.AAC.1
MRHAGHGNLSHMASARALPWSLTVQMALVFAGVPRRWELCFPRQPDGESFSWLMIGRRGCDCMYLRTSRPNKSGSRPVRAGWARCWLNSVQAMICMWPSARAWSITSTARSSRLTSMPRRMSQ